jgi:triacylglycerol lipase
MQDNGRGPPGGDGTAFARRVTGILRGLARPGTYLGAAREIAHGSFQLAAYPFGMVPMPPARNAGYRPPRLRETSLLATDPGMTCTPVVLVHGYVHNRSAFLVMQGALRRAGFQYVHAFNYLPLAYDLLELATLLAGEVERILATWGAQRCMIVGHSMGGMIARTYVQELGGEDTVDTVVTLGSPHRGTYTAYAGLGPAAAQLRPGSAFLRRLHDGARPSAVRWVAFYSDLDAAVVPAASGRLEPAALQAVNVRVGDIGHTSLLLTGEVLRGVVQYLSNPALGRPVSLPDVSALPTPAQRQRRHGAAGVEGSMRAEDVSDHR